MKSATKKFDNDYFDLGLFDKGSTYSNKSKSKSKMCSVCHSNYPNCRPVKVKGENRTVLMCTDCWFEYAEGTQREQEGF